MEKITELRWVKIDKEVLTMVKKSADRKETKKPVLGIEYRPAIGRKVKPGSKMLFRREHGEVHIL